MNLLLCQPLVNRDVKKIYIHTVHEYLTKGAQSTCTQAHTILLLWTVCKVAREHHNKILLPWTRNIINYFSACDTECSKCNMNFLVIMSHPLDAASKICAAICLFFILYSFTVRSHEGKTVQWKTVCNGANEAEGEASHTHYDFMLMCSTTTTNISHSSAHFQTLESPLEYCDTRMTSISTK